MAHFRHETNSRCSARNRSFLSSFAPIILQFGADLRHRRFWRENKIAPSPIIAGLEAILNLHTLRHCCCAERFLLYLATMTYSAAHKHLVCRTQVFHAPLSDLSRMLVSSARLAGLLGLMLCVSVRVHVMLPCTATFLGVCVWRGWEAAAACSPC